MDAVGVCLGLVSAPVISRVDRVSAYLLALRNLPGVRAFRARINRDLAHSPREDPHTG